MTIRSAVMLVAVLGGSSALIAQTAQQPPAPVAAGRGLNLAYGVIKLNISESARKMPDAEFAFRPAPEVRTYGEILGHVSNAGFASCAGLLGESNPNKENFEEKSAKADVSSALTSMFDYCDKAFASVTDENAALLIKVGAREVARVVPAANLVAHFNEHYGNLVTYMRIKGVVPPSTERAMKR